MDEDTAAFNKIMDAWRADAEVREAAIDAATRYAIEVPLDVMAVSLKAMNVCETMAKTGMEASLSDAAVGGLCLETAVRGAALNVAINAKDLKDESAKAEYLARSERMETEVRTRCEALQSAVRARL